jgi:hypothetical protein
MEKYMNRDVNKRKELREQLQLLSKERIIELYIHLFMNFNNDKDEADWEDIK